MGNQNKLQLTAATSEPLHFLRLLEKGYAVNENLTPPVTFQLNPVYAVNESLTPPVTSQLNPGYAVNENLALPLPPEITHPDFNKKSHGWQEVKNATNLPVTRKQMPLPLDLLQTTTLQVDLSRTSAPQLQQE